MAGIAYRVRVGVPWRDVPVDRFGPWQTVYWLFRSWQKTGVWVMILRRLQACAQAAGGITWIVSVDSTIVRAHQHAAGARRVPVEGEPADHGLGRSRGGYSTKIHLACDAEQRVLSVLVTAGQAGDNPMMIPVLEAIAVATPGGGPPRRRPEWVLGDRAYSSQANRAYLRRKKIKTCIRQPKDQAANRKRRGPAGGRPPTFNTQIYKQRNTVERGINQLKQHRAIATRYDKLAVSYLACIHIAAIQNWLH